MMTNLRVNSNSYKSKWTSWTLHLYE